MGNRTSKSSLRNAIIFLNISADIVSVHEDKFWSQIWSEEASSAAEIIKSISTQEIRMLRDGSPKNFATLTYKMVERLCQSVGTLCNTQSQQTAVLNATRILIRLLPCIFEDPAWRDFFTINFIQTTSEVDSREEPKLCYPKKSDYEKNYKSYLPTSLSVSLQADEQESSAKINDKQANTSYGDDKPLLCTDDDSNCDQLIVDKADSSEKNVEIADRSLMKTLVLSVCDLLFCPEFTVIPLSEKYLSNVIDTPPEDLKSIATCDYVWEPGVGFESNINSTNYYDKTRAELLRLLLTCLSTTLYETPNDSIGQRNYWIEIFASSDNRHVLPLFTSLLNTIFTYKPTKLLPFNHLLFENKREELVELCIQVLIATLDYRFPEKLVFGSREVKNDKRNLFIEYTSRIHRIEDFVFLIEGFTRLLNNRLEQSYLPSSLKHINFDQELLVLFWRFCNLNKKFTSYLPNTSYIHEIVVSILYHLNENFQDPTKTAPIHIGVFNLLLLSGERNFGVRLNKAYAVTNAPLSNLPSFVGSHADLLIIIVHKLILYGNNLNQLFNYLITIIVNVSPYLKALSMMASKCLIQLFETFSSPFVVLTEPNYHQLVVFLLEIFSNIVQYQFDGNSNLVYSIVSKSELFINLANMPTTSASIQKVLNKLIKKKQRHKLLVNSLDEQLQQQLKQQQNDKKASSCVVQQQKNNPKALESNHFGQSATVSANQNSSSSPNQATSSVIVKQEVSLVATPDICKVTQSIHQGSLDLQCSDVFFNSQASSFSVSSACESTVSFDDILNQVTEDSSKLELENKTKDTVNDDDGCSNLFSSNVDEESKSESSQVETQAQEMLGQKECWRATPELVKKFKQTLPLATIMRMIEVLSPHVERFKQQNGGDQQQQQEQMISFLKEGTLVGLLPVPHPIVIRKYKTQSLETTLWFRSCTWGIIYVRNTIWTETAIRLIKII